MHENAFSVNSALSRIQTGIILNLQLYYLLLAKFTVEHFARKADGLGRVLTMVVVLFNWIVQGKCTGAPSERGTRDRTHMVPPNFKNQVRMQIRTTAEIYRTI